VDTAKKIMTSNDVIEVLRAVFDERKINYKEMFYVLLLNRANKCIGVSQIGVGATTGVAVNIKEILQLALKTNASGVIISHNHPSGNLSPSEEDKKLTHKVKKALEYLDISLLDHVILTRSFHTSFADEGLL
jgi:DNA repair protein RadC